MRGAIIALVLAVAPTVAVAEGPPPEIDPMGWEYSGRNRVEGDYVFFVTRPHRYAQYGRIWIRYEYLSSAPGGKWSKVVLQDTECETGRTRILQAALYDQNNLLGPKAELGESDWSFAYPGSIADRLGQEACAAPRD